MGHKALTSFVWQLGELESEFDDEEDDDEEFVQEVSAALFMLGNSNFADRRSLKTFVKKSVAAGGDALKFVTPELKKDKEVVMEAVKQYGWALEYADPELKKDPEVVNAARKQNKNAIKFADISLVAIKADSDSCAEAGAAAAG